MLNSGFILLLLPYIIAFAGGLIPVLMWLWFWEHEDKYPEPKRLILYAFIAGMAAVIAVIPFEKYILSLYQNSALTILLWATLEETFKLMAAVTVVLWRIENDEPLDSLMYLIAIALGFAALENTLFIFPYIHSGQTINALIVGNFRFIGATLLHTVSSAIVGIFLALSFYKTKLLKGIYGIFGLLMAIILHTLFNLSIILSNESTAILPFFAVWIGSIIILLFVEKIRQLSIKYKRVIK